MARWVECKRQELNSVQLGSHINVRAEREERGGEEGGGQERGECWESRGGYGGKTEAESTGRDNSGTS